MRIRQQPDGDFQISVSMRELLYLRQAAVIYSTARTGDSIPVVDHMVSRFDNVMAEYNRYRQLMEDRQPSLFP
jgi:hypothetical protein